MKHTCIDLFAGCGGLSLGLGTAGFTTLFGVEAHADAFATYRHNLLENKGNHSWPDWLEQRAWFAQNLLSEHRAELESLRGQVDLIAGGPPCQGFSMNGLRRPDDPRSRMVDVYLQYVDLIRPKLVLLENVVGFQSMKHRIGGTYSDYVARELDRLGYDTWADILKAADWGVPQRRPRFVLIAAPKGSLPGIDPIQRMRVARKSFLEKRGLGPGPTGTMAALSDLDEGNGALRLDTDWGHLGFKTLQRAEESASAYQDLMRANSPRQPSDMRLPRHAAASIRRMSDILENCQRGVCLRPEDRARLGIKKRSTTPLDPLAPAPTIGTLPDDFVHYSRPRSMTVREHARLQSFPDWFSFCGPYTTGGHRRKDACPRFTQVGNAVPPLLAEALGEMLQGLILAQDYDNVLHLSKGVNVGCKDLSYFGKIGDSDFIATL